MQASFNLEHYFVLIAPALMVAIIRISTECYRTIYDS